MKASRRASCRGQIAIFMALSLLVLLGILGLVVDLGWAEWRREAARTAAQAASIATAMAAKNASNLTCGSGVVCQSATACPASPASPPTTVIGNGCLYAQQNGFVNSGKQTVTMATGTSGSPISGVSPDYWVTATIGETIPSLFSAVLGKTASTVNASSTAGYFKGSSSGCIYVLQSSGSGITASGSPTLTSGCGIYVDSNSSSAVLFSGSPSITTTGGAKTYITGGWLNSGTGTITPAPITGAPVAPDPFLGKLPAAPTAGSCQPDIVLSGSTSVTAPAGTYCNAINMSGSSHITFSSGTYVLKNGIAMSGTTSISASGPVTFYLQGGGIAMSGTGGITLSAPTSGTYNGILFWQPYSNTSAAALSGGSNQTLNGIVYVPASTLTYSGGSGTSTNATLVCNSFVMSGNTYINNSAANPYQGGVSGVYTIQ